MWLDWILDAGPKGFYFAEISNVAGVLIVAL
jgi:hypothetical protein